MLQKPWLLLLVLVAVLVVAASAVCEAGMPALLPTNWTADNDRSFEAHDRGSAAADARWQALSFFTACVLLAAWGVKGLWNTVRRDFAWMPRLGYGRALGLVILWGLVFVVVLTMISGARELMTPGAWKKRGWTYTLADPKPEDGPPSREEALEPLRFALWNYAATHEGQFPDEQDLSHVAGNVHVLPLVEVSRSQPQAFRDTRLSPEDAGAASRRRLTRFADISDGATNTLLAGEAAGHFRPWGHPANVRDAALGVGKSLDGFGGPPGTSGAQFLMCDGSVRLVSNQISHKVLEALATPAGGESVPENDETGPHSR